MDNEEALLGCRCISAPILNSDKVAIGALSVAGPVARVGLDRVPALAREVKAAARAVSSAMGFSLRGGVTETRGSLAIRLGIVVRREHTDSGLQRLSPAISGPFQQLFR
jgi:transcriptional regulator